MVFKKNWQFTEFFNYHFLTMKEVGMMDRLFEPYLKKTKKSCPDDQIVRSIMKIPKPIGTEKTFSLYLICLTGFASALLFLLMEIIYHKISTRFI